MLRVLVVSAVLCAACKSDGDNTDETLDTTTKPAKKSSGGFTASPSADLAQGSDGAGERTAGMATGGSGTGSGSGSMGTDSGAMGTGSTGAGSAKPTRAGTPTVVDKAAGSGSAKATTDTTAGRAGPVARPVPRVPVALTAELKAIKLSLLPNWKRDVEEPGTISLFVDVQSKDETFVFKFYYGYDDAGAPTDRDAYKKFLGDSKLLRVTSDRQRGAAWYIEGTDASGPAFRILVTYGGKRLVCYGSLYKGSGFGDIRDEVIIQAKTICESIQL